MKRKQFLIIVYTPHSEWGVVQKSRRDAVILANHLMKDVASNINRIEILETSSLWSAVDAKSVIAWDLQMTGDKIFWRVAE